MAKKKATGKAAKATEPTLREIQQQIGDLLNKVADSTEDDRNTVISELYDHRAFDSMKESEDEDEDEDIDEEEEEYDDEDDDFDDDEEIDDSDADLMDD